jgi:hypothetical protein
MKTLPLIVTLFLASGCFAQAESDPPAPEPCPAVECAWQNADTPTPTCGGDAAFGSDQRFETLDDGASACWIYDTVCVPRGTRAECIPDACRRTFVTCQPAAPMGQP